MTVIFEYPAVSRSTDGIIIHLSRGFRAVLKTRAKLLRAAAAELFLRESCPLQPEAAVRSAGGAWQLVWVLVFVAGCGFDLWCISGFLGIGPTD